MYSGLSINYGRSATNQHRSMDWFKGNLQENPIEKMGKSMVSGFDFT